MSFDYANGLRYREAPRWFDFWNARVVVPERHLFFYLMPFVLSGSQISPSARGLYLYDGGNGGPGHEVRSAQARRAETAWSAAREACEVRWRDEDGTSSRFSALEIVARGPTTRWDVRIEPHLTDEQKPATDERRVTLSERLMLRVAPFIHRVPAMKGYASGVIEQEGRLHRFERAPFYQAKNHGNDLPESWIWIHGNAFDEDDDLAFEAAQLRAAGGAFVGMARLAEVGGTRLLGTWKGDAVAVDEDDGVYSFRARSSDGDISLEGTASHGPSVTFSFPAPGGGRFDNDESLLGTLRLNVAGRDVSSRFAALGRTRRVRVPTSGVDSV